MKKSFTLISFLLLFSIISAAQSSRDYIRNQINYHGNCRNVAITKYGGDLMLYGQNGWAAQGCPNGLTDALHQLNEEKEYIDDVQLTEGGRWLILYGNNGFRWNNIPYSLESKIREYNSERRVVTSVSFNDSGDWIVISTDYFSASDNRIMQWLKEGCSKYGQLWTACVTDEGLVAVYANGFRKLGTVPDSLWNRMSQTSIDIYRLKIAGSAWFFADDDGHFDYHM